MWGKAGRLVKTSILVIKDRIGCLGIEKEEMDQLTKEIGLEGGWGKVSNVLMLFNLWCCVLRNGCCVNVIGMV